MALDSVFISLHGKEQREIPFRSGLALCLLYMIVISWASGMSSSHWSRLSASISFLLLSEPWASYHVCPAVLSVPTSILLILAVCSKNRFVEAMTNAEKKQSCVYLQECRNHPAIVRSALTVLSFPKRLFIINSQCLEIML